MATEEEERRRQQEISSFAAMALADTFSEHDDEDVHLALTPKRKTSGTFAFTDRKNSNAHDASHLDAAVSALSAETAEPLTLPSLEKFQQIEQEPRLMTDTPMFSEEVSMPRPLFFGAIVPPRVLREAREMIRNALIDMQHKESDPMPQLSDFPHAVRNVIGALRVYGFGIDVLIQDWDERSEFWRGDPNVSTYQPVWTEQLRASRVQDFLARRRPDPVTRSHTAPARLMDAAETVPPSCTVEPRSKENEQFNSWLQGDDDSLGRDDSIGSLRTLEDTIQPVQDDGYVSGTVDEKSSDRPLTEQQLFSQWARGNDSRGYMNNSAQSDKFDHSTFARIPTKAADSDDDSVIDDELKKQVGVNDHLSKAIESLAGNDNATIALTESQKLLSQIPVNSNRGRPLTNFELTNGREPLFGCDDPPLPVEGDLGIHETKEEQIKSQEQKRSQEIIEKFVAPNVFGPVSCPNPALNPDDFHSWNARGPSGQRLNRTPSQGTAAGASSASDALSLPSLQGKRSNVGDAGSRVPKPPKESAMKKRSLPKKRVGWWSPSLDPVIKGDSSAIASAPPKVEDTPTQLPPTHHSSTAIVVSSPLEPTPEMLRHDNLPLSRMHAATSMSHVLPYLSDRPPSFRYVQIDAQAVGFPAIGCELEPLYCTLVIYNVETIYGGSNESGPTPDLRRCGRVTEALSFDIVNDKDIAERCTDALWAYSSNTETPGDSESRLELTRCGVFPLPSNLNVANLYAFLIVHKVLPADEGDMDVYLKPRKVDVDANRLRSHAEQSSKRHGKFLVPFAFGVAPLLQVFGVDNPITPTSRAVEIPLSRFSPGLGERQIIDHIMVMLFPKADHRANGIGGPAPVTNGGMAMLVMRNFGYLGLHTVVDNKRSSLARDRLVDFTGEVQLRRNKEHDDEQQDDITIDNYKVILPPWRKKFLAEPAYHGGRTTRNVSNQGITSSVESPSYAMEVGTIPLQIAPSARGLSSSSSPGETPRGRLQGQDIEPHFYTTFCNELICYPRLLHNCPKGNIVIKVELREIEWDNDLSSFLAHRPQCGARIINNRRGPFLVYDTFTSCSPRGSDTHFMDEFKLKLPLDLNPTAGNETGRTFSLLFSVFNVKLGSKNKWKTAKRIFGASGESHGEVEEVDATGRSKLQPIACGFLPLTSHGYIIDNGLHDVRVIYSAVPPSKDMGQSKLVSSSTIVLIEKSDAIESREESYAEDTVVSQESGVSEKNERNANRTLNDSDYGSIADDSFSRSSKTKGIEDSISLSVRVVVKSSIHTPNETLTELFNSEPNHPGSVIAPNSFMSTLLKGRDYLQSEADKNAKVSVPPSASEKRITELVVSVTKHQYCSLSRSSQHLLRIMPVLWRSLIYGNGEPDLTWANPASSTNLRVHTFATILHLLGAISMYMNKNGVTQVDGTSKWNVVSLGRVLALVFDERRLFGTQSLEQMAGQSDFDAELSISPNSKKLTAPQTSPSRKKRHVRQNLDLFNELSQFSKSEIFDSLSSLDASSTDSPRRRTVSDHVSYANDGATFSGENIHTNFEEPTNFKPVASKMDLKVDSKSDFQSALRAALQKEDFDSPESDGTKAANAMIQSFGDLNTGNRRWMTAPIRGLSTIRESEDMEEEPFLTSTNLIVHPAPSGVTNVIDDGDTDVVLQAPKGSVKQMRVPKVRKTMDDLSVRKPMPIQPHFKKSSTVQNVPRSDEEIESAGTAFLDVIGRSLGISKSSGEDGGVGSSYHRKHRSASSIDWTLLGDGRESSEVSGDQNIDINTGEYDETLSSLRSENACKIVLPSFIDRLTAMGTSSNNKARWFPYAYEVIIMQWAAILSEQRASGERGLDQNSSNSRNDGLSQAALRSVGVAIAGAPMLFEIIKQSLGYRVSALSRTLFLKEMSRLHPPLVLLDDALLAGLEQIVTMVADACLDSRNFDSWDLRQMSIDVNDSIVRFLRDLFSFFAPSRVHRLMLSYLSRFVTKDGKQWQDRDSSIGLRCSWEITKLRLNTVAALIRFPDFIRVNSPQMLNWKDWQTEHPSLPSNAFFDDVLKHYQQLSLTAFSASEGTISKLEIPAMRPHWLTEVVVDVCLLGTEHAESYIQQRSSSLLHELFWSCSQDSILLGISAPVASMYITYVEKILTHLRYLSNFGPRSQLRRDIVPCLLYILQSAPTDLLRALWRKLSRDLSGKGHSKGYGFIEAAFPGRRRDRDTDFQMKIRRTSSESKEDPSILDMLSLLNVCIQTMEYEGAEEYVETDDNGETRDCVDTWRKEFLLTESKYKAGDSWMRKQSETKSRSEQTFIRYTTSASRKWQAHDGSLIVVSTVHQIVWELYTLISGSSNGQNLLNPALRKNDKTQATPNNGNLPFNNTALTHLDTVVFVRAATSVYLQTLALRQSDIVLVRTLKVSAEIIKIFGIRTFLEALGETLQHWMRVLLMHCGARRAQVRVHATDLLELILRSTWECYGSFFRIRVPLLAVQTEVMERIVAIAAARYYRDQRLAGKSFETFSNIFAEASLVPLWRTLDRIETQPASQNVAFRGALIRMAGKMKKLYRAYVAARVLSFIRANPLHEDQADLGHENEALVRAKRISVLRVLNASEGHSKQFLGFHATTQPKSRVAHFEAVEDALIEAANVFSPTELPEHRVAWLRMLAEFHASRQKYAEEATCHFQIHWTLQQAARLHGSLWSNTPFLPWTDNMPDPVYIDGDSPNTDPDYGSASDLGFDDSDGPFSHPMDIASSFRRIFYRVANSVGLATEDSDGIARTLFCGVNSAHEYHAVTPWMSLREMEEHMVEEAESAGDLFLRAGIVESSRLSWNLATQYYVDKFNYTKLAIAYGNLARTLVSRVPPIDASLPQEVSATLGRFYRVWFHGGAPDELSGVEFVYRTEGTVRLEQFGDELRDAIKSIVPDKTPIHLVLDGRNEERLGEGNTVNYGFSRIGPAPLEPVKIKVTPLRPLFGNRNQSRGLPEWFHGYVEEAFSSFTHRSKSDLSRTAPRRENSVFSEGNGVGDTHHREHQRSFSASVFSSSGSSQAPGARRINLGTVNANDREFRSLSLGEAELSGVDKFCFVQPKDRSRTKEWWSTSTGDYAEKSLKVTQLQVNQAFPACVARQAVVHRLVYSQSPLEAGVDAVCQWCAVLFRTAVATVGMAVLRINTDPGIGTDAAKVVADSIHSSNIKEIGMSLLMKNSSLIEGDSSEHFNLQDYDRLSEDEIKKLQIKLARLIIVFIELLHLLIARNRDILLGIISERKTQSSEGKHHQRDYSRASSLGTGAEQESRSRINGNTYDSSSILSFREAMSRERQDTGRTQSTAGSGHSVEGNRSVNQHQETPPSHGASRASQPYSTKADSAIAVQSELQRAFINMVRTLYPRINSILHDETPHWLKQCSQESYFSVGQYKQTQIPISEELCFSASDQLDSITPAGLTELALVDSPRGSMGGSGSVVSRNSEQRYGFGQF